MHECDNCGSPVSDRFHAVFADNAGTLHGCHNCTAKAGSKHPEKREEPKWEYREV